MKKYLLVICLLSLNIYANKNWIKIDSHDINDTTNSNIPINTNKTLKLAPSNSSIKAIQNLKQAKKSRPSKTTNSSDKELLEIFKQINNMANKVQSKIKKEKPTFN